MTYRIFAADIGGTSARFGLFDFVPPNGLISCTSCWLPTEEASSFVDLLQKVEKLSPKLSFREADICVFAIAGPVRKGHYCKPPNIDWDVDLKEASSGLGITRYVLVNDFVAQAFAARSPIGKEARQIISGEGIANATIAIVGAGTGFGKAALFPRPGGGYLVLPSEGGHGNVSAESKAEVEFLDFVKGRLNVDYPIWDNVVSGLGLVLIHEYLTGDNLTPAEVGALLERESDTLVWAATFYGRACRNYALEVMSLGGLYIAGGVAAKNPLLITHQAFRQAFHHSTAHRDLLEKIPVFQITDEESGLWGAAQCGANELA